MSGYAVSKLISIMQEGLLETQENAGRLILSPFAEQADVDITPKMISNLVKGKKDVHPYIRDALTKSENIAKAIEDIKTNVVPMINNNLIDDTCLKIIRAMQGDSSVPAKKIKLCRVIMMMRCTMSFFQRRSFMRCLGTTYRKNKK